MSTTRTQLLLACLVAFACSEFAGAQRIDTLAPLVRRFVRISAPRVVLVLVQLIEGTGGAPTPDRNISIVNGKISGDSPCTVASIGE